MVNEEFCIDLSPMDCDRFGIRIAKSRLSSVADTQKALAFCKDNEVRLLIARCHVALIEVAHRLESEKAQLMDSLAYFSRDLKKDPFVTPVLRHEIRPMASGEEKDIVLISKQSFHGYMGHYHADPLLPRALCDEIYEDWTYRSCISKEVADEVFVAIVDRQVAGFLTVKNEGKHNTEFVLSAIHENYREKGIYSELIAYGLDYAQRNNKQIAYSSTQGFNRGVQRTWARLGMLPDRMYYTFHLWFK